MYMKKLLSLAALVLGAFACNAQTVGTLVDYYVGRPWRQSVWISAQDAQVVTGQVHDGTRAADGASWFVSKPTNSKRVKKAVWKTTALGTYELYINRQLVGNEVLKPGFTHYEKTKYSFTYDITKAFNKGAGQENELAVQVTPGWWADKIVTPGGHDGMIGKKVAFRGVLLLKYADGSEEYFPTNLTDWKAGVAGPVTHAAIFDGEDYDARKPQGWESAGSFSKPELNEEFSDPDETDPEDIRGVWPTDGAEIYHRWDLALSPVKAYTWKGTTGATDDQFGKINIVEEFAPGKPITVRPGETLVVDFGQNASAVPAFDFKAKEGTVLTCLPSELLNDGNGAKSRGMDGPEGSTHRLNLRIPDTGMQLHYTFGHRDGTCLAKDGFVSFIPRSTFFGYRFVSITATDEVTIRSIKSVPVTSIAKELETGTIETGSADINKLISNTVWGQRSNYLSVPTDCPQRNERLGWTADTQVFTETGTFFANTDRFFHKWMRDMRDTQSPTGAFPGVAPLAQYGAGDGKGNGDMMRVGWADAGIIVPWTIWKQFGDKDIVGENWKAMSHFFDHIRETKYEHTVMTAENGNYQWADWLSYEPLESCSGRSHENGQPKPEAIVYWNYLSASYWAIDAAMMLDMARVVDDLNIGYHEEILAEAKAYIKEKFLNDDGSFKLDILNTMQTPALFALKNNLLEGTAKANMIARLRENFRQHDNCLQTGFLGTSILMQTLTDNGMQDIAYELLFQHKNPSWLYSVDNGATTIWERWNSYTVDAGMGPRGMNSFNHYAYGCVCQWLWETAAGIAADPKDPGFRHIIMKPVPDKRLGHLKAEYKSAAGLIKSAWQYKGNQWIWTFTIPKGATATVTLPGETTSKEYKAGTYTLKVK
ncbi:MAG: family 78 glycoside hydrolase catalytic domain [Bacteroidaceae bacterium]|nr:family 78 glycoside hydrolase catalytic domain [Bacteroidaceae bacterium]